MNLREVRFMAQLQSLKSRLRDDSLSFSTYLVRCIGGKGALGSQFSLVHCNRRSQGRWRCSPLFLYVVVWEKPQFSLTLSLDDPYKGSLIWAKIHNFVLKLVSLDVYWSQWQFCIAITRSGFQPKWVEETVKKKRYQAFK